MGPFLSGDLPIDLQPNISGEVPPNPRAPGNRLENYSYSDAYPKENALLEESGGTPWRGVEPQPRAPLKGLHPEEPFLSADLPILVLPATGSRTTATLMLTPRRTRCWRSRA